MTDRLCLGCKHCRLINETPAWSEWTPGEGMAFRCTKNYWRFDTESTSKDGLEGMLRKAQTCPDYQEEK